MFGKSLWYTLAISLCFARVAPQETATRASFLEPRNFNYHPYELRQYPEEITPTKQGPVLFPNDGPPPPRRPLIVTSRTLLESIEKSDLNPNPPNNSIAQNVPTQNSIPLHNPLNHVYPLPSPTDVTLSPDLLANISPISNNDLFGNAGEISVNNVPEASSYNHVPYAEMLLKARLRGYVRENGFSDYEERTVLPPIYKALSEHARRNVVKPKPQNNYNYQIQNLDYGNHDNSNRQSDDNGDYDQDQNYAFSYRVKDQKTGDDFSHKQQSVSGGTNGEYRVRLPDGRVQIVSYTADENGYKADVRYDEENDEVNISHRNNIKNDYDNSKQYNDQNVENNYVTQNGNIKQYNGNGFNNNNFNDLRQYDNQNVASNYFRPQETNLNQYDDRIFVNNYVKHDNNVNQFDNQNIESVYFKQNDGNARQYENVNLRNDYVNYKDATPIKEDANQYNSKEYYDYSSEYTQNYEPYNSKFVIFKPTSTPAPIVTTLRPNYAEIKGLFTVAPTQVVPVYLDGVISATNNPIVRYESATANGVSIGGKQVQPNVNHIVPTEPTTTAKSFAAVTPAAYLASTIASLRDRNTPKPVGFGNFINNISKYLSFK